MNKQVRWQSLAKGVATRLPVASRFANLTAGSPVGARYFYTVWLRHLVQIAKSRPVFSYDVVAELGPGDALGIGLCALLSGAKRYIGLDRIAFGLRADNLAMLRELIQLFSARAPIPDDSEFPGVYPKLDNYAFPDQILTDQVLSTSLALPRLARLHDALSNPSAFVSDGPLTFAAPWDADDRVQPESVDLLLSQAVLEHVDDIDAAYAAMRRWLRPDGTMSHRIDYTCHGITRDWYGHWTVSPRMWRLVRGDRAYLINRLPHSAHVAAFERNGFVVVACQPTISTESAPSEEVLVPHTESDLNIKGAFFVIRSALR